MSLFIYFLLSYIIRVLKCNNLGASSLWRLHDAGDHVLLWYAAWHEPKEGQRERGIPAEATGAAIQEQGHQKAEVWMSIFFHRYLN